MSKFIYIYGTLYLFHNNEYYNYNHLICNLPKGTTLYNLITHIL